uniref:RING-type E3 ubiquitin transferase n=2 Tax=Rhizophora mucronata TaxID=61149 RepID=A0A2P2JR05_RHIMU
MIRRSETRDPHKGFEMWRRSNSTLFSPSSFSRCQLSLFLLQIEVSIISTSSSVHKGEKEMGDAMIDAGYWCRLCCTVVSPIMDVQYKCPICESGYVEEIGRDLSNSNVSESRSESAYSHWATLFLGLTGGLEPYPVSADQEHAHSSSFPQEEGESERGFETLLMTRRARSSSVGSGSNLNLGNNSSSNDGSVILVNPFIEGAFILQSSYDADQSGNPAQNVPTSFGDYLIGPGLDLLVQNLTENDSNQCGTPPAKKEAVQAMPIVAVEQELQCPVCLEEFEIGGEAKEMPCRHQFHDGCICTWLEHHSCCPICRFLLPSAG